MFQCKNCGAGLKFDIPSQKLTCEYCNSQEDPYAFENKTKDAVEERNFEVTIFTCPQCGGEILSTDNAISGFCSFCGASTVLYSRISNEKRPGYIIPFRQTKEACKQAYANFTKRAFFAPKELKNAQFIDSFRGIYMPYWAFHISQKNDLALSASKSYRRGDYIYTDHYTLHGHLDAYYKGLSYDASSSFADEISESVAPFDVKGMKAFTPAYLSGFYADSADVSPEIYRMEAEVTVTSETNNCINKTFPGFSIPACSTQSLNTVTEAADLSIFPVWFMSYRNKDRVAYATVNGQTGKVVADLPVDIKKYTLFSLILALPIFVLLNLFLTVIPTTVLTIIAVLLLITVIISSVEINKIGKKERYENDRGYLSKKNPLKVAELNQKIKNEKIKKTSGFKYIALLVFLIPTGTAFVSVLGATLLTVGLPSVLRAAIFLVPIIVAAFFGLPKISNVPNKKGLTGFITSIVAAAISGLIILISPVSDLWYYGASLLCLVTIFCMIRGIMLQYNILSTRRLPQFDKEGGDHRA